MATRENALRLHVLFEGYLQAHGTYDAKQTETNDLKGGKIEIKGSARTLRRPVTVELWEEHLAGTYPIGVIPVRDNNTCLWGAIDVDRYDITYSDLFELVKQSALPLVPGRSKSGGIHLYLFLQEPVPARVIRAKLLDWAADLGFGGSEVFPKQEAVDTSKGDLGSWLNMPYFNDDNDTSRYGIKAGGLAQALPEFLALAESSRVADLSKVKKAQKPQKEGEKKRRPGGNPDFGDGPPCMQQIAEDGLPNDGDGRRRALFAMAIFARKKYGARWEEMVENWNRSLFGVALTSSEVLEIIKSAGKKDYNYPCKEFPISTYCNASKCRTRRFGVGGADEYPQVTELRVLDTQPPVWFLTVNDRELELTTEELQNYKLFHKVCMERLHACFRMIKATDWLTQVSEVMRTATTIEAPQEVSTQGQLEELVEEFLNNRHKADTPEDLALGLPYRDPADGRHYFRLRDLERFLVAQNFRAYGRNQITQRIRDLGGDKHQFTFGGIGLRCWWIPSMAERAQPALPRLEEDPI